MEPQLSRILVESEADWLRIKDNVGRAIHASMETRLAALPGGKDGERSRAVRKEVEARIAKITDDMWKMTNPNLRVNGHNYEDFVQATEAFDEGLDRKIWGLHVERIAYELGVSELRKRRPEKLYRSEEDLERRRLHAEWLPEGDEEDESEKAIKRAKDIPKPLRHDETVETFNTVVQNLSDLATTAPAQLARAQRAQNVRDEIAGIPL